MAKLHGAAKAEFLARMARGRRKAGITHKARRKRIRRTARSSVKLRRRSRRIIRSMTRRRKTIKRLSPRRTVARRRRAAPRRRSSGSKGILGKIPLINNPTFRKAALGVGTATLGIAVLGLVAPSIASNPIVRPVLALAGGGVPGVIAQVLSQGGLGALTGGGSSGGGAGFA